MEKRKKVLVICGGGAFGILPAFFLKEAFEKHGRWLDEVDCLSGCSIGGILTVCYAAGVEPVTLFQTFKSKMPECFDKRFVAKINPLACPTYSSEGLDAILKEFLKNRTMEDIRKTFPKLDVFVPALNITQNRYKVFDNITGGDSEVLLRDIGGFTSAAPSYYYGREFNGECIVDGGLIEVDPLITTATGLKGKRGTPFLHMDVLMVGCGEREDQKNLSVKEYNSLSLLGIATDVLQPYATLSNSLSTEYWGKNLGFHYFQYFNPVPISGRMDDVKSMNKALEKAPAFSEEFCRIWKEWLEA